MTTYSRLLSFVLPPVADDKEFHSSVDLLAGLVLKSKTEAELVVCLPDDKKEVWTQSSKTKSVAEALAKGKITVVSTTANGGKALGQCTKSITGEWVYVYHPHQACAATNALNWFNSNHSKTESNAVWFVPAKDNHQLGLLQKLLKWKSNFINETNIGSGIKDLSAKAFLLKTEKAKELFGDVSGNGLNLFTELLGKMKLNEVSVEPAVVALKTNPYRAYKWIGEVWSALALVCTLRWYWHVKKPISEFKTSPLSIGDGGHPMYRFAFFLVFAIALVAMPYLSFDFGVTWDEKAQNEYGKDMLKFFFSFGEDKTVFDTNKALYSHLLYYGSFFDLLAAFVNDVLSPFGEFETRHLLNSLFGLMAMTYAALTARELGNWRTAFFALLLILITPQFFGQSMNNPKDIPFAAGYIFSIYHLIRFLKQLPNPRTSTILFLILGIALTNSMRIGGIILLGFTGLFMGFEWLAHLRKNNKTALSLIPKYLKFFFTIAGFSYFIGILFWPFGITKPFTNPIKALKEFTNFSLITSYENFEGVHINMAEVPWYYTLKYIGITVPVVALAGAALGLLLIVFARKKFRWPVVGLLVFVIVFPVFYAAYKNSMLYNGWRHFLFIYPPMVAIAACGWDIIASAVKIKAIQLLLVLLPLAGLAEPLSWMIRNHPNEYVYFNQFVGGIKGAYGKYETDYYGNVVKQATEWLLKNEPLNFNKAVVVAINNEPLNASYYSQKVTDSIQWQWTRDMEWYKGKWDYAIYTTRTLTPHQLATGQFPPKEAIHVIEADGVPLAAILKSHDHYLADAYPQLYSRSFDSAIVNLKKAIAWNPNNEEAHRVLGGVYVNMLDETNARIHLKKALELIPENYEVYDLLGLIEFNKKNYEPAIKLFHKSYGLKINYAMAYYHAATSYMNMQKYAEAIPEYENCIKQNGKLPEIYMALGQAYFLTGNYAKCVEAETNAVNLRQEMPQAYEIMRDAYTRMGNQDMAQACTQMIEKLRSMGVH